MSRSHLLPALLVVAAACSGNGAGATSPDGGDAVWVIDSVAAIHGLVPTVHGAPAVTSTPHGDALCFDGDDAVVVDDHPLEGLGAFTLEVLVRIDGVTDALLSQPRFLHIEAAGPARATIEARVNASEFYLDSFLLGGGGSLTLADSAKVHPVGGWTWTAVSYDGAVMRHFVDGIEEASGPVAIPSFGPGKMSLGVRQNLVYWFSGCIREVRATAAALGPEALKRLAR